MPNSKPQTPKKFQVPSSNLAVHRILRSGFGIWNFSGAWCFGFGFLSLLVLAASAQTIQQILTNGPTATRINIVFLSEGYTTNQLGQFSIDATNVLNKLLSTPPFSQYSNYFNAFAISVASVESGSDHPCSGTYKNTYFNSTYDSYDTARLITIPPNRYTNTIICNVFPQPDL